MEYSENRMPAYRDACKVKHFPGISGDCRVYCYFSKI